MAVEREVPGQAGLDELLHQRRWNCAFRLEANGALADAESVEVIEKGIEGGVAEQVERAGPFPDQVPWNMALKAATISSSGTSRTRVAMIQ